MAGAPVARAGEWRFAPASQTSTVAAGTAIPYAETYQEQTSVSAVVQLVHPPGAAPATHFYPGQLVKASAPLTLSQATPARGRTSGSSLRTLDLAEAGGSTSLYVVQSLVSTATPDQLRAAGDTYPSWVLPYGRSSAATRPGGTFFPTGEYRPAVTLYRTKTSSGRSTEPACLPAGCW